jgi:nicotinamide phosphoribosyltransferase
MTIENTDPDFPWLTNYLETMLLRVWYPITVATISREIKKVIKNYHTTTGSDLGGLLFKLHDFGYRGVSSEESAAIGGAAHLVNFRGSDTLAAFPFIEENYGYTAMPGFSIPATEHSNITSWGKENEEAAYRNVLRQYPDGIVACVSDSYDLQNAASNLWGDKLRLEVLERDGILVIRPDSGKPEQVVPALLGWLGEKFGTENNASGFKVLNPKVRVIQGDGVDYFSIIAILSAMKAQGWAAENVAFGMGGALLQKLNRDTQKFAIKCSSITIDGKTQDVWKDPVGDKTKASKRGRLILGHDGKEFRTCTAVPGTTYTGDRLQTVFENGELKNLQTFPDIRERAEI